MLIHARGVPDGVEAILFMLGNVAGFAILGSLAFRRTPPIQARATSHPVLWGSFHFVPVAASVGIVTLVAHLIDSRAAWPLAGLAATSIYLTCVAAQITLLEEQVFEEVAQEPNPLEHQVPNDP